MIPEFLMLLKGVIDCPDLPLNVSRSALQNDGFVKKIADYITKKVADKLSGMCKTEKEAYEKYWDDISPFIKFGCLKDDKFCEKINDYILFKDLDGKYLTLPEALKVNDDVENQRKMLKAKRLRNQKIMQMLLWNLRILRKIQKKTRKNAPSSMSLTKYSRDSILKCLKSRG